MSHANIHRTHFWFLHYYLLRVISISLVDILHTFHSMCCTMLRFSTPPPHTNTLRTPLTKLSRDNICPHCTHTNQTHLCFANIVHMMHAIISHVYTTSTLLCICTLHNAKFSACTRTRTFFRATPNVNACTCTSIFFCVAPKFWAHTNTLTFFHAIPKVSVCTRTPTFFHAMPKFSAHTSTPIFSLRRQNLARARAHQYFFVHCPIFTYHKLFTAHHAFLVRPPAHIHFYAHQFLVNSGAKIGAFA
jgi:hypothetical protein